MLPYACGGSPLSVRLASVSSEMPGSPCEGHVALKEPWGGAAGRGQPAGAHPRPACAGPRRPCTRPWV